MPACARPFGYVPRQTHECDAAVLVRRHLAEFLGRCEERARARFPSRPGPCQNLPTAGSAAAHRTAPHSPSPPNSCFKLLKRPPDRFLARLCPPARREG